MRFAVDISRTKLPFWVRRSTAFRNSKIRLENIGFVNYELLWFAGFDVALEWGGKIDPVKPQWAYRGSGKTKN